MQDAVNQRVGALPVTGGCDYIFWERPGISVTPSPFDFAQGRLRRGVWPRSKGASFAVPDVSIALRFTRHDN